MAPTLVVACGPVSTRIVGSRCRELRACRNPGTLILSVLSRAQIQEFRALERQIGRFGWPLRQTLAIGTDDCHGSPPKTHSPGLVARYSQSRENCVSFPTQPPNMGACVAFASPSRLHRHHDGSGRCDGRPLSTSASLPACAITSSIAFSA